MMLELADMADSFGHSEKKTCATLAPLKEV
jgi:hypothetical protein